MNQWLSSFFNFLSAYMMIKMYVVLWLTTGYAQSTFIDDKLRLLDNYAEGQAILTEL